MKYFNSAFVVAYVVIAVLFLLCAVGLICVGTLELWEGLNPLVSHEPRERFDSVLECIGLLTIAVASLELGQTIFEEEVVRNAHMSAPTRVRRFVSRFMVVIVVSLAIECLVAVFQLTHKNPMALPAASMIGVTAAALLAAWGVFLRLNKSVEEIEPEAMEQAKSEDRKIE